MTHEFYEIEMGEYEFYQDITGEWVLTFNHGYNDKFNKFIGRFADRKDCIRYCKTHKNEG